MPEDLHFMTDNSILRRISSLVNPRKNETILEIGPGHGELTRFLTKARVIAVEKNRAFASKLALPRVSVVHGNVLKELPKLKFDRIVSNLPYSICEPLFRMLPLLKWKEGYFTIPEGFASRLGKEPYSSLFTTRVMFEVPKSAFSPPPRTSSVFVRVLPRDSFLKDVFLQKKSKLKNAIMRVLSTRKNMTKNQAREALKDINLNTLMEKHVNELSPGDFSVVAKKLEKLK